MKTNTTLRSPTGPQGNSTTSTTATNDTMSDNTVPAWAMPQMQEEDDEEDEDEEDEDEDDEDDEYDEEDGVISSSDEDEDDDEDDQPLGALPLNDVDDELSIATLHALTQNSTFDVNNDVSNFELLLHHAELCFDPTLRSVQGIVPTLYDFYFNYHSLRRILHCLYISGTSGDMCLRQLHLNIRSVNYSRYILLRRVYKGWVTFTFGRE